MNKEMLKGRDNARTKKGEETVLEQRRWRREEAALEQRRGGRRQF